MKRLLAQFVYPSSKIPRNLVNNSIQRAGKAVAVENAKS